MYMRYLRCVSTNTWRYLLSNRKKSLNLFTSYNMHTKGLVNSRRRKKRARDARITLFSSSQVLHTGQRRNLRRQKQKKKKKKRISQNVGFVPWMVNNVVSLHCVEQTLHTGTDVGCGCGCCITTIMLFKDCIIPGVLAKENMKRSIRAPGHPKALSANPEIPRGTSGHYRLFVWSSFQ